MKKTIIATALLLFLGGMSPWGQQVFDEPQMFLVEDFGYHKLTDKTVEFLGYKNTTHQPPQSWVVPSTIEVDSVTYTVTRIGHLAFYGHILRSVVLPPTITELADESFFSVQLNSLTLPDSITTIGRLAFGYSDITSLHIPAKVTEIGDGILYKSEVATLTLDTGNHSFVLIDGVLYNRDTTVLLACQKDLPTDSFVVPATVTSIPEGAMSNAQPDYVVLPEGLRHIGKEALPSSLSRLHIPASVVKIDGNPIADQPLPDMVFSVDPLNTHYRNTDGRLESHDGDTLLMVVGAQGAYVVPDGVKVLGAAVFRNCFRVTSVQLPEGLVDIGWEAFMGTSCSFNFPTTLRTIGESAFMSCSSLDYVVLPPRLRTIGEAAFKESSISYLQVSDSVTHIGAQAFSRTPLAHIVMGRSVESIGQEAFYVMRLGGTSVTFPPSLRTLGYQAFRISGLGEAIFEGSPDTIGAYCLPVRVVRFSSPTPPVMFARALMYPDTVYIPCGATAAYQQNSQWNPLLNYQEDCSSINHPDGTSPAFSMYPNPTTGKVTVTVAQPAPKCELTLRDAAGHEVMRKEFSIVNSQFSIPLDLRHLSSGAYFVTLSTPTASSTQRLVVK